MINKSIALKVSNLHVEFDTYGGVIKAVRGVSFSIKKGLTTAIVGESGCGKSVTVQSIMGLIPKPPGKITRGEVYFEKQDILKNKKINGKDIRGSKIGMIFQDPMTSLNPTMKIGDQVAETIQTHLGLSYSNAFKKAIDLLDLVQIPDAKQRASQYPFELSGGMLQRSMIAMAVACRPSILIADEPTTALDVTIQSQILSMLSDMQKENDMAIILITHDLGVVAEIADEVLVMYGGEIVEKGDVNEIYNNSSHPYTLGLKEAMPTNIKGEKKTLKPIEGSPPDLFRPPIGCSYFDRCPVAMNVCEKNRPETYEISKDHHTNCWAHHKYATNSFK
ncbi:MAG: peptide ABC transporter ATP-binding protein [Gammaproteobacteria bacterium TMED78]|nr:MAG: peptide ABC transporter ATP-binding protein [Gammaproteobacteria bacterium TMED78]|tara:strand:+ start:717 stop:1718 length:1002 start_codon:yes stop_codon:yes gene_type:complete